MPQYIGQHDQILHSLANAGWADDSTGAEEAPTGAVYLLHLTAEDLGEPYLQKIEKLPGVFRKNLLGDFIVTEKSDQIIAVKRHANQEEAVTAFKAAKEAFLQWARW